MGTIVGRGRDISVNGHRKNIKGTGPSDMTVKKDARQRNSISRGDTVHIVTKNDQNNGHLTEGKVQEILTGSSYHPHGIKVRLDNGNVGRVKKIF